MFFCPKGFFCKVGRMPVQCQKGFTIVEILIASVIVSVAVVGTVTLVRTSQDLSTLDRHRRAARFIIDSHLEQMAYQQVGFAGLTAGTTTRTVTIDSLVNGRLAGVMTASVSERLTKSGKNSTSTPYKKIVLKIKWLELGWTDSASVRVEKWVSP
jgi:prepilin-type N-terminal cleavage/methylation domain-containing protein